MATLFGRDYTRAELLQRVGDISQLGGVKPVEFVNGNERGVRAAEFKTGAGLNFTVLLDRGLDISAADYCGQSLCWRSSTGDVAPAFYEPEGLGWLRSFFGGLLITCGLTYIGSPSEDQGKALGLHGRVANLPAKNVWMNGCWEGDDYIMWVQGKVQETAVFQENLVLHRKIWARLGESRLFLEDVVENQGYTPTENMMLYHINAGFPVVDEGTELIAPFVHTIPRTPEARQALSEFSKFGRPMAGFQEQVYFHDLAPDQDGYVWSAMINRNFKQGQGLGLYVKYRKAQLPQQIEWKMTGEGIYVVGMEPGTNWVDGRGPERDAGRLILLQPGETRSYQLEIGVLACQAEIAAFEEQVKKINRN
jgi:hypothetical protein